MQLVSQTSCFLHTVNAAIAGGLGDGIKPLFEAPRPADVGGGGSMRTTMPVPSRLVESAHVMPGSSRMRKAVSVMPSMGPVPFQA